VLGSGNRHIGEAVVNQKFAFPCVHVDQHPLRGLSLAAVAGHCVVNRVKLPKKASGETLQMVGVGLAIAEASGAVETKAFAIN
jgi:hypothetical protein